MDEGIARSFYGVSTAHRDDVCYYIVTRANQVVYARQALFGEHAIVCKALAVDGITPPEDKLLDVAVPRSAVAFILTTTEKSLRDMLRRNREEADRRRGFYSKASKAMDDATRGEEWRE